MKLKLYKLPFFIKFLWAKLLLWQSRRMIRMFRGFGETYPNDIVLYTKLTDTNEELELWIKTKGRPSTSNVNYQINTH